MTDFDEEVPEGIAQIVGHVCGLIFIFLAFLSAWFIHLFFKSLSLLAFVFMAIVMSLTYFFGSTAIKLTTGKYKRIINKAGFHFVVVFLLAFSVLTLIIIFLLRGDEIVFINKLFFSLLATVTFLFAFELIKYLKNKRH